MHNQIRPEWLLFIHAIAFFSIGRSVFWLIVSACFGGCSIQPSIEDVTSLDVPSVVRKIRCEARQTIKKKAVELVEADHVASRRLKDDTIDIIENRSADLTKINYAGFEPRFIELVRKYDGALIFFDFTFTISEENNVSSDINLLSTLMSGTNSVNFKASNNRMRKNLINFRVQDSFAALLTAELTCHGASKSKDYLYPITGEIGLYRVVSDFIEINETKALVLKDNVPLSATTLTFTTAFTGSANPKLVLSPVGKSLSVADAAFTAEIKRSDQHEVLIGLSLPQSDVTAIRTKELGATSPQRPAVRQRTISGHPVAIRQLNYFMDQQIGRNIITNLGGSRQPIISLFP